ncbi:MAG: hypothetical protein GY836_09045 [Herbaspirillum sp.]|uniref:hypothetical protein n=1 Tax=Herbaspirillum sp. TaxID=1890675 RepID=UPI002582D606|nr:hypothetical protein [Herbaspirillum sp.]MCP4555559.1 hypothetical protein [Herbaspirillum sp.]
MDPVAAGKQGGLAIRGRRRSREDPGSATDGTAVAVDDYLATAGSFTLPVILPVVEKADAFLEIFPPGSNPRGSDRQLANVIKDDLDDYHDNECARRGF